MERRNFVKNIGAGALLLGMGGDFFCSWQERNSYQKL